jgi:hypothetical protein
MSAYHFHEAWAVVMEQILLLFIPTFFLWGRVHPDLPKLSLLTFIIILEVPLQSTRNHSRKIRHCSLLSPGTSAFMQLYNGGQDDALITMTGLNFSTFHELLAIFSPIFHENTPHIDSGSNISQLPYHTIDKIIALSLVLVWTWTRGTDAS